MAQKLLKRSKNDRMIYGVLGGLGEYFDIDTNWIRLAVAAAGGYMFGKTGVVFTTLVMIGGYAAATFIIPEAKTAKRVAQTSKSKTTAKKKSSR